MENETHFQSSIPEFKPRASAEMLGEGGDSSGIAGRIGGPTQNWAPIALSDGMLLIRDHREMKCVRVTEQRNPIEWLPSVEDASSRP